MPFLLAAFIALICLVLLQYYWHRWPVHNFPPGPFGYPLFGNVVSVKMPFQLWLMDMTKKYGDVYSLAMDRPTVVINNWRALKEAIVTKGNDFGSRTTGSYCESIINPGLKGIFFAPLSPRWHRHRQFALTSLRGFGFGKTSFESKIMEEVELLLEDLQELQGHPQSVQSAISVCVSNIMCDITFGTRFQHTDRKFQHLIHIVNDLIKSLASPAAFILNAFPVARPFMRRSIKHLKSCDKDIRQFLSREIDDHLATFETDHAPRDLIDCYLSKMKDEPEVFTKDQLYLILADVFGAGTETTATTLTWGILYMVIHPDIQEKVHEELMKVVGAGRLPSLKDREHLPYTSAVILEIHRMASVVPVTTRCTTTDTSLDGFDIPKGTNVICSLWSVNYSPELWSKPDEFNPGRYLKADGGLDNYPTIMPFGAGRRVCMGESLAKMEVFLFFSSLMHRFNFKLTDGAETPSLDGDFGLTRTPKPFEVVITQYA